VNGWVLGDAVDAVDGVDEVDLFPCPFRPHRPLGPCLLDGVPYSLDFPTLAALDDAPGSRQSRMNGFCGTDGEAWDGDCL